MPERSTPMFAAWAEYKTDKRSKTHWFRADGTIACGVHMPLQEGHYLYVPETPDLECLTCQRINLKEHGGEG